MDKPLNTFEFTPMVRVDYSFPDVDDKTRRKIYDVIFDGEIKRYRGGGGDGSTNSGVMYVPADQVEGIRQRLVAFGLTEVKDEEA
jgi:hypothetical protein